RGPTPRTRGRSLPGAFRVRSGAGPTRRRRSHPTRRRRRARTGGLGNGSVAGRAPPASATSPASPASEDLQPGDPLGLEHAGTVGAHQPDREAVVDVQRPAAEVEGEERVWI